VDAFASSSSSSAAAFVSSSPILVIRGPSLPVFSESV
jgi:hypothetical protein